MLTNMYIRITGPRRYHSVTQRLLGVLLQTTNMRVHLYLLVCAIICAQLKYTSSQVVENFGDCATNEDCPDFSTCVTVGMDQLCRCDAGYDALDLEILSAGQAVTVCRSMYIAWILKEYNFW